MNPYIVTSYDTNLVILSFFLSFIGSFVALSVMARIVSTKIPSLLNIGLSGLALGGIGIWAMHFIGMLAHTMDVGSSYSSSVSFASLLLAVVSVSIALSQLVKNPRSLPRLVLTGTVVGLGVAGMHYLGMYGMKFGGFIFWDFTRVAISVLIAVVAATTALWLSFNTESFGSRAVAALVMAAAVSAMHYVGMSAADFVCTTVNRSAIPIGFGYVPSPELPTLVVIVSMSIAAFIGIDQFLQAYVGPKSTFRPTNKL